MRRRYEGLETAAERARGTNFPGGSGGSRVPYAEGPGLELGPDGEPRAAVDPVDHRGRGPRGYRRSDSSIREELCERLTHDAAIDPSGVEVVVGEGDVLLVGTVDDRETRRRIEDLAYAVSGVREVDNLLRVGTGIHAPRLDVSAGDFDLELGGAGGEGEDAATAGSRRGGTDDDRTTAGGRRRR